PLSLIRTIFPMPGFVEIRMKPEPFGILHQPLINSRAGLKRTIVIARARWLATDIQIQRAPGEMGTVNRQSRAASAGRLLAQLSLIFGRAERGENLQKLFGW